MTPTAPVVTAGIDVSVRRVGLALMMGDTPLGCDARAVNLSTNGWSWAPVVELFRAVTWSSGVPELRPDEVWVEWPAMPRQTGPKGAFDAGRAVQVVYTAAAMLGWPLPELIVPAEWKRRAGVAERKGATRKDVLEAVPEGPWPVARELKAPEYLRALDLGFDPDGHQDAADAALIAVAGRRKSIERSNA